MPNTNDVWHALFFRDYMRNKLFIIAVFIFFFLSAFTNTINNTLSEWIEVSNDDIVQISYKSDIITDKNSNHIVWVKANYYTEEWQRYFARMIGSKTPVATTHTKAEYNSIYSLVRVRQVICFSTSGEKIYDSGDDRSAGWGYVNASDPVGIVGEYLCDMIND